MVTLNLQVGASSDDANEVAGSPPTLTDTSLNVGVGFLSSIIWASGYRFTGVTIAGGSTIDTATVTLKAQAPLGTVWLTKLRAHAHDNSPTFTTTDGDVDARAATTAGTDWDPPAWVDNTSYTSPSIVAVIQEIIDRAGWASGNALSILHRNDGSADLSIIIFDSYDALPADAPKLDITYTAAAGVPTVPFGQHPVAVPQKREVVAY